ncbi:RNA-directed DNA polymerase, eukaryota, reverse transcriptase zinc-binding domain protein [Tanacetum coccineum]
MADRTARARLSNTFIGNINNTGYALTKFCMIRSLNLDTNLPIDLLGEVISWEYEMQECEVNRTKQKPLFIQLKNEVDLELTCFAFSNLADKLNEYISSLKSTEKFSVMIKNARIYVDHKVVTLIMRSKRTIKPVKIFDNYVTNSIRNKNNQKNSTKKKRNIISNEMDDLNDMVDVEGGDGLGDRNGGKDDENRGDQYKDGTEEIQLRKKLKGNNDHKENINSGSTYTKMVTKDMHIVNNKLDFIPTEINENGSEIVIFDEDLVDKGKGCGVSGGVDDIDMKNDGTCMFKFRNEAGMNKVLEQVNVPLEAWSKEGISALASSLCKPLIMDTMTAKRCSLGEGRMDFARILVEFDVMKGFKEEIEIQYRDKDNNKKGTKHVKVKYAWKPDICSHCKMGNRRCGDRKQQKDRRNFSDGRKTYDEIRNKRDIWKRKEVNKGKQNNSRGKEQEKEGNDKDERDGIRSRNKFEVLNGMATNNEELEILKGRMIVDVFLIKKTKLSCIEVKDWTQDMMNYYKNQLEINKLKDMEDGNEDIEDVLETNSGIAKDLSTKEVEDLKIGIWNIRSLNQKKKQKAVLNFIKEENINICGIIETHIKPPKLSKVASMVFGGWDWVSNSVFSTNGCRIMIGWDKNKVDVMVVHMTRQVMLVIVEIIKLKQKVFCSFVYASNSGSRINRDMQEFRERVHDIEVDDINYTGLFYTWIKSPSKPETIILKKLDRAMVNSEFIDVYGSAYARFHPFLISDHSPVVIHLPNTLERKKKSFKFSNFVVDKADFLDVVKKEWKCECNGYLMYKLVKKIKRVKIPLNNLTWKKGNLFQNVRKLEEELKRTQVDVEANPNCKVVKEKLSEVLQEYNEALNDDEKLLAQKAKVKWLSEGDKNTKYFHNVVKSIMHSNRSMRVCDDKGNWFEGDDVADQFVKHFERFLGNNGDTKQIDNPDTLFLNKLSKNEAEFMVKEITDKEIKEAMFGNGNDKAPAPDGFTAIFFKKSWDIMGMDVCGAVKEIFNSNKLLGEINATLITLVPKIHQPNKVSDYRPVACCNVIYKCISKIITKRLQGCLDKLVSINQSAFVPGRLIQDNVLITQELLKGYNRKSGPRRYALKIDIAKAYDTVNWDFLKQILTYFGFHEKIIGWIMTCVTSATFTVCVNGGKYGYFKNRRGLRQGDPMSPYLFTLIIEVLTLIVQRRVNRSEQFKFHWGCKEIKLTQLYFADDLLMICNGDHKSVKVLKEGLMEFSKVSGLVPNMNKSTIFFGNVREGERQRMLEVMPFAKGTLLMKYLGIPLITKNIGVSECNQLVERLITSVLASIHIYRASVFLIPKTTVKDIEKALKGFLWCHGDLKKGAAKVVWKVISNKDSLWVKWVNTVKLKNKSIWEVDIDESDSPICDIIPFKKRYEARMDEKASVADMIVNGVWNWPKEWESQFRSINDIQIPTLREGEHDCLIWKDHNGNKMNFFVGSVWEKIKERKPEISWHKVVWYPQCNPRHAFIVWLAMHKRLATQDMIMAWNKSTDLKCPLCMRERALSGLKTVWYKEGFLLKSEENGLIVSVIAKYITEGFVKVFAMADTLYLEVFLGLGEYSMMFGMETGLPYSCPESAFTREVRMDLQKGNVAKREEPLL